MYKQQTERDPTEKQRKKVDEVKMRSGKLCGLDATEKSASGIESGSMNTKPDVGISTEQSVKHKCNIILNTLFGVATCFGSCTLWDPMLL
jgi:hypothetical protein